MLEKVLKTAMLVISRPGSSPGGKTLLKRELKKQQYKSMQILRPLKELKLEAITFIVAHETLLTKR